MTITNEIINKLQHMNDGKKFLNDTDINLILYFLNEDLKPYFKDDKKYEIFRTKIHTNDCLIITDENENEYGLLITPNNVLLYEAQTGIYLSIISKTIGTVENMLIIKDGPTEICKYYTVTKTKALEKYNFRQEKNAKTELEASLSAIGTEINNRHYFQYKDTETSDSLIESMLNTVIINYDKEDNFYNIIFNKLISKAQKQKEELKRSRKNAKNAY